LGAPRLGSIKRALAPRLCKLTSGLRNSVHSVHSVARLAASAAQTPRGAAPPAKAPAPGAATAYAARGTRRGRGSSAPGTAAPRRSGAVGRKARAPGETGARSDTFISVKGSCRVTASAACDEAARARCRRRVHAAARAASARRAGTAAQTGVLIRPLRAESGGRGAAPRRRCFVYYTCRLQDLVSTASSAGACAPDPPAHALDESGAASSSRSFSL
jgi:hypothetical protein